MVRLPAYFRQIHLRTKNPDTYLIRAIAKLEFLEAKVISVGSEIDFTAYLVNLPGRWFNNPLRGIFSGSLKISVINESMLKIDYNLRHWISIVVVTVFLTIAMMLNFLFSKDSFPYSFFGCAWLISIWANLLVTNYRFQNLLVDIAAE